MVIIFLERALLKCVAKIDEFFDLTKQNMQIFSGCLLVDIFDPFNHPVGPGGEMTLANGE